MQHDWSIALALFYLLFWFYLMWETLSDQKIDPITKLTWTIVLIFVPILGIILYFLVAPRGRIAKVELTHTAEDNLKGTPWENDPSHTKGR